ncbi:putative protein PTGES3L isoform X1 [Ictalurus furcatus]|uniref:putative protein PTGES3L isoform X1 n=1 Tax=Ictalurus furcatus TaxID=66913 RepID=UPI0023502C30|nr:putative protein PTGES3L isoform X1 [Ictalurus furcatus]
MPPIVRPDDCQPAKTLWFDRKKYITINFLVQKATNVQVDIQDTKMILSCKDDDDNNIYNEIEFYDRVHKNDSREKVYDRTINVLIRKMKDNVAWPRLTKDTAKPAWLSVDFDNWRDWEHEEEDGQAEFEQYMDVSTLPHHCLHFSLLFTNLNLLALDILSKTVYKDTEYNLNHTLCTKQHT